MYHVNSSIAIWRKKNHVKEEVYCVFICMVNMKQNKMFLLPQIRVDINLNAISYVRTKNTLALVLNKEWCRTCRCWFKLKVDTKCWSDSAGQAATLERRNG